MSQLATYPPPQRVGATPPCVALVGNPNAGKTALFNALTGLRGKTANYPGITVDIRRGRLRLAESDAELLDLPGLYSLDAMSPEEDVATGVLQRRIDSVHNPDVLVLVIDATNVERNLFLAGEIMELNTPTVVALNLIDAAQEAGIEIDIARLSEELRCPVVPVSARTKAGLNDLKEEIDRLLRHQLPILPREHVSCSSGCSGCSFAARYSWAHHLAGETVRAPAEYGRANAQIDGVLTNPVLGVVAFLSVMLAVFYTIFALADVPMTLIDTVFAQLAGYADVVIPSTIAQPLLWSIGVFAASLGVFALTYRLAEVNWTRRTAAVAAVTSALVAWLPLEDFRSLVIDGVIAGVGSVVIFLPQICILFLFISLLEDSGYMARAAFVMERLMRRVGLPGKAFVPMLSAHACAIPGIMATRVIDNWRDRLVTILVLPLLTCSARLPVYAMVAALLFADSPGKAAWVFLGAYLLGIVAALSTALVLKKSILPGESEPLVLELPPYRLPSLRNAIMTVIDRALVFLRNAGTAILLISVVLWALATYPKLSEQDLPAAPRAEIAALHAEAEAADATTAAELTSQAERLLAQEQLAHSFAGRLGHWCEPIFRPLGFDWRINVGVISSFAAREVIVSTLAIVYGIGEEAAEEGTTLVETLRGQVRPDGTPVFSTATCLSLLVFYVLAMQCLPTQVVTRRETGTWKWALFQLGYMTVLAYVAALVVYQSASALGWA